MDTAVIAQLVTGVATLIIGAVLLFQLRKQNQQIEIQNKQLELQHQDSDRQLGFASRQSYQELTLSRITNESLLDAYMKVSKGVEEASDKEIHQFVSFMRTAYLQLINSWNLGVYDKSEEFYKGNFGNLMGSAGERKYYLTNGRIIVGMVFGLEELVKLGDIVYEELEGIPVPA